MTSKRQLIDDIRCLNPGIAAVFLAQFDESALRQYLEHLQEARRSELRQGARIPRTPKLRMAI